MTMRQRNGFLSLLLIGIAGAVTPAYGQISGAGQLGCNGASTSFTAITSGTSTGVVANIAALSPIPAWQVTLNQTSTITAGAITFQLSYDNTNWVSVPPGQLFTSWLVPLANPYTLVASTNQSFIVLMNGAISFRLNLTSGLTGSGTVTPFASSICSLGAVMAQYNSSPLTLLNGQMAFPALDVTGRLSIDLALFGGNNVSSASPGVINVGLLGNAGAGATLDAAVNAAPPANGLQTAGLGSGATGGQLKQYTICDQWVAINGTASAQLIAGVSGRKIYFCNGNIQMNGGANTISFVSGTGSTCGTGTTSVPGFDGATAAASGYSFAANSGMAFGGGLSPFARTTNNADNFCVLVGSATRVVGGLSYAIY